MFEAAGFARRFLAERNLIMNVSAVLWRREALLAALRRCGPALETWHVAGDWRIYLELLTACSGHVVYLAAPLNVHRRHDSSATHRLAWSRHVREIAAVQSFAAKRLAVDALTRDRQKRYVAELASRKIAPPAPPARPGRIATRVPRRERTMRPSSHEVVRPA